MCKTWKLSNILYIYLYFGFCIFTTSATEWRHVLLKKQNSARNNSCWVLLHFGLSQKCRNRVPSLSTILIMLETSHPRITNEGGGGYTPIGLPNLGAISYLNALIQCFCHMMPIWEIIFGLKEPNDETKRKLLTALKETLNYISSGKASEKVRWQALL